jgi:nitronate monooxygenase/enoyl-[acyl-carrier protein] reductase II
MIQTSLTRLLGITHPVIQGSFGPWPAVELAAAVSEAGGLGAYVGTMALVPQVVDAVAPVPVAADWKRRMVESASEDAVKVGFADEVFPPPSPGGFAVRPRSLRTALIDNGAGDPDAARAELMAALAGSGDRAASGGGRAERFTRSGVTPGARSRRTRA